ncbi:hypothetical protein [Lentibacillus saliphilus]|uniref:hypothetical protein n=1 Tax=Lentibacillus saliphilus TaxID=2737028 RepID=UPI001C2F6D60|nr:hypothetical protein [Lentibacillus saliphilus]
MTLNNKKTNYITGDLSFEGDELFICTVMGEDIPVRDTDILRPLIRMSDGSRQRSLPYTREKLLNKRHLKQLERVNCYLFHRDARKFVYMKDGITALIDNKPGDEITVIEKYWELDEGEDAYRNGTLVELHGTHFVFQEDGKDNAEKIYFVDIRNVVDKEAFVLD